MNLPIQITRLDVAKTFRLTRGKQDQIGGEEFVGFKSDDVSDANVSPRLGFKLRPNENFSWSGIQVTIGLMSFLKTFSVD